MTTSNPWLKANPFMSMWLTGANAFAGSLRGHAMANYQRMQTQVINDLMRQSLSFWSAMPVNALSLGARAAGSTAAAGGSASDRPAARKSIGVKRNRRR